MSIKKSLLALAVAAMAMMAFASPAMATDGTLVHHVGTAPIPAGKVLHTVGWARFENPVTGDSYECHVTSNVEATGTTGTTGDVTQFTVPDTTKCVGKKGLNGCTLKSHTTTNLPYHATVTDNGRIDITGNIVLHNEYSNCLVKKVTLTFTEIQLTPLSTKNPRTVTGTLNKIGDTAALNETIAGFEIDSSKGPTGFPTGKAEITNIFGGKSEENIIANGEFELTSDTRCTYEIIAV